MPIFLFIIGLVVGSFLNVVSLRYKEGGNVFNMKAIGGRSKCLTCQKQLSWKELIPLISFFFQKGQCRHCGHKISLQYPIVELLSGLIFVSVPLILHASGFMLQVVWLLVFLLLLLLSSIDFRLYVIPDSLQIILAVLGIGLTFFTQKIGAFGQFKGSFLDFYAFIFGFRENIWLNRLLAVLIALVIFGFIIAISRGKGMGWGDFKLAGVLAIIFGWPDILLVLALSFIIGAIFSIILVLESKKRMKDAVPFGPFMAMGATAVFFFGPQIVGLYLKLISP